MGNGKQGRKCPGLDIPGMSQTGEKGWIGEGNEEKQRLFQEGIDD